MSSSSAASPWPVVTTEEHAWSPSEQVLAHLDVFARHRLSRPYRSAVLPPIADHPVRLESDTLALADEATSTVIRFDERMRALPVPMPTVLLRSESASSSQIEHLTTNARNLALAEIGLASKQNADLVAGNVRAMRAALELDHDLDATLVLAVHAALLDHSDQDIAGSWRDAQVWIGSGDLSPHGADFVPPHHTRVQAAIDDLMGFAARTDVPALPHAALVHAQFESIHPFIDGNGRTGRVLLHLVLRNHGVARHTTVPVSAGLLRDTSRYFAALAAFQQGEPDPIVRQVAHAAMAAVLNGQQLADDVIRIRATWRERITARRDASAWRLADALLAQPVVDTRTAAALIGVAERNARTAIETLEASDVIAPFTTSSRGRAWQAPMVLEAMDDFAKRAGRRA